MNTHDNYYNKSQENIYFKFVQKFCPTICYNEAKNVVILLQWYMAGSTMNLLHDITCSSASLNPIFCFIMKNTITTEIIKLPITTTKITLNKAFALLLIGVLEMIYFLWEESCSGESFF